MSTAPTKKTIKIRKSNPDKPVRVVIYGDAGVGKTTFGAMAPKPIFISAENGADNLRDDEGNPIVVDEMDGITNWESTHDAVKSLITGQHDYQTLVLDSADWLEGMCHSKIIGNSKYDIIRVNGGYSAGLRESEKLHREFIKDLSILSDTRNMNIIIIAHAQTKEAKDPEMVIDYDQFQMKMDHRVWTLWKEWCKAMIFVRFKTFVKENENAQKKGRAFGTNERVAYTVQRPAFHAKNRYGLPDEMPFTMNFWNDFYSYAKGGVKPETVEQINVEIADLWAKLEDEETKQVVTETIEKAGSDIQQLKDIRERLREVTTK